MKPTPAERWIERLQRNRLVAVLLVVGTIVIALATFTDSLRSLAGVFTRESPEEARLKLTSMQVEFTPESFLKAAEDGDLVLVNLFITGGMDPSLAKYASEGGPTPLFYAARENHPEVVEALLEAGAVVTGPNNYALAGAVHSGNTAILKRLLETPVKPEDLVGALTQGGNREMLEILVAHGADVPKHGAEALFYSPDESARDYLRKHGADINAKDANGKTLVERLNFDTLNLDELKRLIAAGADLKTPTRNGEHLIHNFAGRGFVAGVKLLLAQGAEVDTRDAKGCTPLIRACQGPGVREEMVQLLLDHRADVNARDQEGHTPLYYAKRHVSRVISLLASQGGQE